jgi:predicted DNA-binding protein
MQLSEGVDRKVMEGEGRIDICMLVCYTDPMKKKMKTAMFRTTVYLPERVHRGMKQLAAARSMPMADLLRDALEQVYKDDLADIQAADEAMREYRKNPKSAIGLREYLAKRR